MKETARQQAHDNERLKKKARWNDNDLYRIGKIGKPHGVKGEVSFHFDDDIFDRTEAQWIALKTDGLLVPFFIEEYRFKGNETALMKFCGIDTQERARQLTGCEVFFPRTHNEDAIEDLSWAALVGFSIIDDATHRHVGNILAVNDTTINTLFEVSIDGGETLLIPAAQELITSVNTAKRELTLRLPEGILELN